jgi:hypothetical protein
MTVSGLWVSLLAGSLSCSCAQVTVEVTQEQQHYLQGEALPVTVRITNRSGQSLHLGAGNDWLAFSVEGREGMVVPQTGDVPVAGEFTLESSKAAVKRADLAPWFVLNRPGHYAIVATVRIKEWNQEVTSRPAQFDIIDAPKLWEQPVGLPRVAGATNGMPEVHKYILQQATYLKSQLRLYLRVTDAYEKALRVIPIGPMLSFSRPDPRVDKLSNLHLLYQSGPYSFSYSVFSPEGEVLTRQTYDYLNAHPHLRTDEEGNISVIGGVPRVMTNDVPPPKSDDSTAEAPAPNSSPAQSNTVPKP